MTRVSGLRSRTAGSTAWVGGQARRPRSPRPGPRAEPHTGPGFSADVLEQLFLIKKVSLWILSFTET